MTDKKEKSFTSTTHGASPGDSAEEELTLKNLAAPTDVRTREWAEKWVDESIKAAEEETGIKVTEKEREVLISWYLGELTRAECEEELERSLGKEG